MRIRVFGGGVVGVTSAWYLAQAIHVPCNVYPAKGYSATIDIGAHHGAPTLSLTDFAWKIVLTRLGQRLRFAGTAELTRRAPRAGAPIRSRDTAL